MIISKSKITKFIFCVLFFSISVYLVGCGSTDLERLFQEMQGENFNFTCKVEYYLEQADYEFYYFEIDNNKVYIYQDTALEFYESVENGVYSYEFYDNVWHRDFREIENKDDYKQLVVYSFELFTLFPEGISKDDFNKSNNQYNLKDEAMLKYKFNFDQYTIECANSQYIITISDTGNGRYVEPDNARFTFSKINKTSIEKIKDFVETE